jgi:hypothetical protein
MPFALPTFNIFDRLYSGPSKAVCFYLLCGRHKTKYEEIKMTNCHAICLQEFGGRMLTTFVPNQVIEHQNEAPVQPPLAQLDEIFEDGEYLLAISKA